ncbi:MAG: cupin domain-containing protein [Firmicutes bacterium]|nr:cupin domain-containing protein [Bacillota bacterium]
MYLTDSDYWINKLGLKKHPEGGYFCEIYRSSTSISPQDLNWNCEEKRASATSIYFLLTAGDVSKLHRLKADELWYYHAGSPLTVTLISPQGDLSRYILGLDLDQNEQPQLIIPAGSIFGASVNDSDSYSLVSCMVTPGFDFRDFELLSKNQLIKDYSQYQEIINELT